MNNIQQQIEIIVSKKLSEFIEDEILVKFLSSEIYYVLKDSKHLKSDSE